MNYNGDRYGVQYEKLLVDDHFNPEVGFLRRARRSIGSSRRSGSARGRGARRAIRKYSYSAGYDYIANTAGPARDRDANLTYGITFQNGDGFNVERRAQLRVPAGTVHYRAGRARCPWADTASGT